MARRVVGKSVFHEERANDSIDVKSSVVCLQLSSADFNVCPWRHVADSRVSNPSVDFQATLDSLKDVK
jgi:hypothetical protein